LCCSHFNLTEPICNIALVAVAAAAAAAGGPLDEEAAAKRPRLDFVLTAEEDFLAEHGDGPSKVNITVNMLRNSYFNVIRLQ
jgi:hypothetical protein